MGGGWQRTVAGSGAKRGVAAPISGVYSTATMTWQVHRLHFSRGELSALQLADNSLGTFPHSPETRKAVKCGQNKYWEEEGVGSSLGGETQPRQGPHCPSNLTPQL